MGRKNKTLQFFLCMVGLMLSLTCIGCGNTNSAESVSDESLADETSSTSSGWVNVDQYEAHLQENRIPISDCKELYSQEIQQIMEKYPSFSSCTFYDFPDTEDVSVLVHSDSDFSTQEAWDYIKQWLIDIGKYDRVDMNKDVHIVTSELDWDPTQESPDCYPILSEHMDLRSGSGALLSNHDMHIVLTYSMNDGKMNEYLGLDDSAENGALGDYSEDIIDSGSLSAMADTSYPLINGTLTIGEGADLVKDYFKTKTILPPYEGVENDTPEVQIFRLGDVYGYAYTMRRLYNNIPFAYTHSDMDVQFTGAYYPYEDIKVAYVVDDTGVSAYYGYDASTILSPVYTDTQILSLSQAVELLSENLASRMNVEFNEAGLEYMTYFTEEDPTSISFPCWMFYATNNTKGEKLIISVDALTGYVYYYTTPLTDSSET